MSGRALSFLSRMLWSHTSSRRCPRGSLPVGEPPSP
nr:MAG TPA: hypothetical protein [Caudoviricetes sp.]